MYLKTINAPVFKDIEVGEIRFSIDGKLIAKTGIKTGDEVPAKNTMTILVKY